MGLDGAGSGGLLTEPIMPALCRSRCGSTVTDEDGLGQESCAGKGSLCLSLPSCSPDTARKGINSRDGQRRLPRQPDRAGAAWNRTLIHVRGWGRTRTRHVPETAHLPLGADFEPVLTTIFQKEAPALCVSNCPFSFHRGLSPGQPPTVSRSSDPTLGNWQEMLRPNSVICTHTSQQQMKLASWAC